MKRWQRLGQVEDSEDDDSDLADDESERSQPSAKRLKYEPSIALLDISKDGVKQRLTNTRTTSPYPRGALSNQDGDEQLHEPRSIQDASHADTPDSFFTTRGNLPANKLSNTVSQTTNQFPSSRTTSPLAEGEDTELIASKSVPLASNVPADVTGSPSSSGLSSVSDRDLSPPPFLRSWHARTISNPPDEINESGDSLFRELLAEVQRSGREPTTTSRRNLRARQDKQLHPYLYDKAQYQQQWKSRGLRPVHFQITDRAAPETQDNSFSEEDDGSVNADVLSFPELTSTVEDPSPLTTSSQNVWSLPLGSDDDLPEASALVKRRGHLRSKNTTRKAAPVVLVPHRAPDWGHQRERTTHADNLNRSPTPPTPLGTLSSMQKPHFRLPRGLARSYRGNREGSIGGSIGGGSRSYSSSEDRTNQLAATRIVRVIDSSSDSDAAAESERAPASDNEDSRIRREKKRIRGVLPASWLKIDLKAQLHKSNSAIRAPRLDESNQSGQTAKGIAQKVGSRNRHTPVTPRHISFSDTDSSNHSLPDKDNNQQSRLNVTNGQIGRLEVGDPNAQDVMEVDYVDPMLAGTARAGSRKYSRKPKSHLRQPRIEEAFATNEPRQTKEKSLSQTADTNVGIGNVTARRHRKSQPAKRSGNSYNPYPLSIIDAPGLQSSKRDTIPQFVRLAMRQARHRTNQGRHMPTGKIIRLSTAQDTNDANGVLLSWRNGTMAQGHNQTSVEARAKRDSDPRVVDLTADEPERLQRTDSRKTYRSRVSDVETYFDVGYGQKNGARVVRVDRPMSRESYPHLSPATHPNGQNVIDSPRGRIKKTTNTAAPKAKPQRRLENRLRQAQLESLEVDFARENRAVTFERRMLGLANAVPIQPSNPVRYDLSLQRFLASVPEHTFSQPATGPARQEASYGASHEVQPDVPPSRSRRIRKRLSRRLNVETTDLGQIAEISSLHLNGDISMDASPSVSTSGTEPTLVLRDVTGLGEQCANDFDIRPLNPGAIFDASTFIGSGEFDLSLNLCARDLAVGNDTVEVGNIQNIRECGAWTEEVASHISSLFDQLAGRLRNFSGTSFCIGDLDNFTNETDHMFRSILRYLATYLKFMDPIDRQHCIKTLRSSSETLLEAITDYEHSQDASEQLISICCRYVLVVTLQAGMLAENTLIDAELPSSIGGLFNGVSRYFFRRIYTRGFVYKRDLYDLRQSSNQGGPIYDAANQLEDLVVFLHCMARTKVVDLDIWGLMQEHLSSTISTTESARVMDDIWRHIFTLLPTFEIDAKGVSQPDDRVSQTNGSGWSLVKQILLRLFQFCPATTMASRASLPINEYIRVVLRRCHLLIAHWGWWRCEPVLGIIFDFFAQRGLAQLKLEESRGSPRFLEQVDSQPDLEVYPDDRSFHIFLKALALGIKKMRINHVYSDKKIAAIAYRFIPNHGRTYLKSADISRVDLDSLRNHFDLLSTLYFVSPPGRRINIQLPRDLVNFETSHNEACRLSVRCWANMLSYQASTTEELDRLSEFVEWFESMQRSTISLYQLARSEAEQDFATATAQGPHEISRDLLEATVLANQRQIVATMIDLLGAFKRGLRSASSLPVATTLVAGCPFWNFFFPLDVVESRMLAALYEAVEVSRTCIDIYEQFRTATVPRPTQEESQDYGDFDALEDFVGGQDFGDKQDGIITLLLEPLGRLISNVFGGDLSLEEGLIIKIIDVWTQLAKSSVTHEQGSLARYVDGYNSFAWNSLLDTDLRRKFTPYFLAQLVEHGGIETDELRNSVLTSWMAALVDREASLKFQHRLTEALLNSGWSEPLLENLPFYRDTKTGKYHITLADIRQRRLSLISSLLSSMRAEYDMTLRYWPAQGPDIKHRYSDMLQSMMRAMQDHYCSLQGSAKEHNSASEAVQGAYVQFVQQVVGMLQQYTTEICRIDRFFTDSGVFPLPAEDPTYVVGRLKSYVPKLSESGTRKQLAVFVQTVGERAAADAQEEYLMDQLSMAMDEGIERGDISAPSLRYVLLASIFPAYIEAALSTATAWISALPILRACSAAVERLLREVHIGNAASEDAVLSIITAVLTALTDLVMEASTGPNILRLPQACVTLRCGIEVGQASLTVCEFVSQMHAGPCFAMERMCAFRRQVLRVRELVEDMSNDVDSGIDRDRQEHGWEVNAATRSLGSTVWPDTLEFARQQVREAHSHRWYERDRRFYLRRGNASKEIHVTLDDTAEETLRLRQTCMEFEDSFRAVTGADRLGSRALR